MVSYGKNRFGLISVKSSGVPDIATTRSLFTLFLAYRDLAYSFTRHFVKAVV